MLSCKDITEKASAYLDKEMPLGARMSMRMHLFMCNHCRRYMDQLQITINTLKFIKKDEPVSKESNDILTDLFKKEMQEKNKTDIT